MSASSAVLTGLSLVTGIAREATDGVPIVKQILAVASRIVGLAEQVEKNREDLHALAERAKSTDRTIRTAVGDREPETHLLSRLEDMNVVLRAVEKHFDIFIRQGRVRKTLGCIFTVRKEVDRLRGEFDDRLRELEVAASLDTNIAARTDARFNGEFRNIRHCEIDLLRRITRQRRFRGNYTINCHLATCDGSNQVVVFREMAPSGHDEDARRCIEDHDKILEQLSYDDYAVLGMNRAAYVPSLVQNRHSNIVYLYGRNTGPTDNRFLVLKAGDIRCATRVIRPGTAEISFTGRIVAKLAVRQPDTLKGNGINRSNKDAACHLQKYGAAWACFGGAISSLYLDTNYEPKVGLEDDLCHIQDNFRYYSGELKSLMGELLGYYCTPVRLQENEYSSAHFKSTTWSAELFGTLIEAGYRTLFQYTVLRRADTSSLIPLSQESRTYLRPSYRIDDYGKQWSSTLVDLAMGATKREGSFLRAEYRRLSELDVPEVMEVYCTEHVEDAVYQSTARFEIPSSAVSSVRHRLGIPSCDDDQDDDWDVVFWHLERFSNSSATHTECTGWRRKCAVKVLM